MIEKLQPRDIAPLVRAICAKLVKCPPEYHEAPDTAHFVSVWERLVASGVGTFYGAWKEGEPVGLLCGVIVPDPISGKIVGHENLWLVLPRSGQTAFRLMDRFEADVKAAGGESVVFGCVGKFEKMCRMYASRGYKLSGMSFRKQI